MRLARRELARGGRSLGEVAHEVGYESEAAFSREFERAVGVSPSIFRAQRPGTATGVRRSTRVPSPS